MMAEMTPFTESRERELARLRETNAELLVAAKQAVTAMEHAGVGFCESALRAAIAKATHQEEESR